MRYPDSLEDEQCVLPILICDTATVSVSLFDAGAEHAAFFKVQRVMYIMNDHRCH